MDRIKSLPKGMQIAFVVGTILIISVVGYALTHGDVSRLSAIGY